MASFSAFISGQIDSRTMDTRRRTPLHVADEVALASEISDLRSQLGKLHVDASEEKQEKDLAGFSRLDFDFDSSLGSED